jgi:hypothetical protein
MIKKKRLFRMTLVLLVTAAGAGALVDCESPSSSKAGDSVPSGSFTATVHDRDAGMPYSGSKTLTVEYYTGSASGVSTNVLATVSNGVITITLPETSVVEAEANYGTDDGILMAEYWFPNLGIGEDHDHAEALHLRWLSQPLVMETEAGAVRMKAGWQWIRGNTHYYESLEKALEHDGETGNKLFLADNDISWTASVSGVGSGTLIKLTFAKPVEVLSADDITLSAVRGAAIPVELTGSGTEWTLAAEVPHTGDIEVSVKRWGLDSKYQVVTVNSGTSEASSLDRANWMGRISDNTRIDFIAIPGTHDSATAGVWAFTDIAR